MAVKHATPKDKQSGYPLQALHFATLHCGAFRSYPAALQWSVVIGDIQAQNTCTQLHLTTIHNNLKGIMNF